jgi:hypothetical protein
MPKSTGPLQEQLGLGTANQSTPNNMTDNTTGMADKLGANKDTNAIPSQNPSVISSAGAIGKQCISKDGVIGSQFDASKNGIAGHVERAVDGPSNPAGSSK